MGDNWNMRHCEEDPDAWTPFEKPMDAGDGHYGWRVPRAGCRGDKGTPACPLLAACKEWALQTPDPVPFSMAGGYTPKERAVLRAAINDANRRASA